MSMGRQKCFESPRFVCSGSCDKCETLPGYAAGARTRQLCGAEHSREVLRASCKTRGLKHVALHVHLCSPAELQNTGVKRTLLRRRVRITRTPAYSALPHRGSTLTMLLALSSCSTYPTSLQPGHATHATTPFRALTLESSPGRLMAWLLGQRTLPRARCLAF